METPERILRRLEFKVVRRLDGFLFGDYTGVFYGPSLDLAEVRQYQPGDAVRRIDWNVTARMNQLFVRQYREEKELTAWLLVDLSPSMDFGTVQQFKRQVAVDFAGVAAYIIARHGDKVGTIGFPTRTGELFVPPRTGRQQPLRIVHALAAEPPVSGGGRTDLGAVLQQMGRIVRRRSLVFLISDFHSPDGWDAALAELGNRHVAGRSPVEVCDVPEEAPVEFTWPVMLWGLLLLPAFVAWYVLGVRKARRRAAGRFAEGPLFAQLATSMPGLRRHVSMALYFVALALLLGAVSRPVMGLPMPVNKAVVVLAVDTSGSMVAPDVPPSRLEAAKAAARAFVDVFPQGPRIGLVSFSTYATLMIAP